MPTLKVDKQGKYYIRKLVDDYYTTWQITKEGVQYLLALNKAPQCKISEQLFMLLYEYGHVYTNQSGVTNKAKSLPNPPVDPSKSLGILNLILIFLLIAVIYFIYKIVH